MARSRSQAGIPVAAEKHKADIAAQLLGAPGDQFGSTGAASSADLLAQLPALLSPAEAASWLGVSTETIRRHTRQGKLPVVKVLGVTRIPATSATALVRAKVVSRLPARYRKPLRDQDV